MGEMRGGAPAIKHALIPVVNTVFYHFVVGLILSAVRTSVTQPWWPGCPEPTLYLVKFAFVSSRRAEGILDAINQNRSQVAKR